MLMTLPMGKTDWHEKQLAKLNEHINLGVSEDTDRKDFNAWHVTRFFEFPWCLEFCPPKGKILDVGSTPQWHIPLLSMGHSVTVMLTCTADAGDLQNFGRMNPWEEDGGVPLWKTYCKYEHQITWMIGYFEDLHFLAPESFDTIYSISVTEHVLPEQLDGYMEGIWKALKPGGRLCMTCDWWPQWAVSDGMEGLVMNYDLMPWLKRWKVNPIHGYKEIPWSPEFEGYHEKTVKIPFVGQALIVYAMVLEKPK